MQSGIPAGSSAAADPSLKAPPAQGCAAANVRHGAAHWRGGLKDGGGTLSTGSGALHDVPYGLKARFQDGPGSNPEELIGAAHAGCFSMALAMMLGEAGLTAEAIHTDCAVTLEKGADGFAITSSHLTVQAVVPGATVAQFDDIAQRAKANCPVSRLLHTAITLDATLAAAA